jgi:hypothetical protein
MQRLLALLVLVFGLGCVLFLGPDLKERLADNNSYQRQLQLLEEERRSFDLDRYQQRQRATLPAEIASDYAIRLILFNACLLGLYVLFDMYRQRRVPLVRADQNGLFPITRPQLLDGEVLELVREVAREAVKVAQLEAIHQPGQLPHVYSPHISHQFEYSNDIKGAGLGDQDTPPIALPDVVPLSDILPSLPKSKLAYGMLPSGELLSLPIAAGYHALYHGDTRSGKTNAIDSMLVQIHHKSLHYSLHIIAGDFKRELAATWKPSPLITAVETEVKTIGEMLDAVVNGPAGILARYSLFAQVGERTGRVIRNLGDYVKVTGERPELTFITIDELNALLELCDSRETLRTALKHTLQLGAGAGYYVLGGAQYLSSTVFRRDGSKQFVTRAHFGPYDKTAVGMMFGGMGVAAQMRELLSGIPGRGLIRTAGQASPQPFQALRCDEEDILDAIHLAGGRDEPQDGAREAVGRVPEEIVNLQEVARDVLRKCLEAPEADFSTLLTEAEIAVLCAEVRHRKQQETKTTTIRQLWSATGGRRFQVASRLYEYLMGAPT